MKKNNDNKGIALDILCIITLIFIGLKKAGVIGWSWFWVFSPLILPFGIVCTVVLIDYIISKKDK